MPIKFNLEPYKNKIFVETGTYHGKGCINAIKSGFKTVYSIEVSEAIQQIAIQNIKNEPDLDAKVELYLGNSADVLSNILEKIDEPATFWLDGHGEAAYSLDMTNCPLYEELDAIEKHHIKDHTIMIDDLRIIRDIHGQLHSWGERNITEQGIMDKLKKINPDYEFAYEDGEIPDDCLVAYIKR